MTDGIDPQMELMFSFYERLHRKAPGSEASTRKAFSMLSGIPASPDVVEFGCGSGASALVLAEQGAHVTAVEIYRPFLVQLEGRARAAGLAEQIRTVCGNMASPAFPDGSFDVVWSEGAIYLMGFEEGLRRWRRLLRPGGRVAVTEVAWLSAEPPQKAAEFWAAEYPSITTIEGHLEIMRAAKYEPIGHFVLPAKDWADYYDPLEQQLALFRAEHAQDGDAQELADGLQREIDLWKECGDSYGYVFYLAEIG